MRSSLHTTWVFYISRNIWTKSHFFQTFASVYRSALFVLGCVWSVVHGPFFTGQKNERTKQHNKWVELKAESEITISKASRASGESDGDIWTGIQNTIQILPLACHKSCFPSLYLRQIQFSSPLLKHREKSTTTKQAPQPSTHPSNIHTQTPPSWQVKCATPALAIEGAQTRELSDVLHRWQPQ